MYRIILVLILAWLVSCEINKGTLNDPPVAKGSGQPTIINIDDGLILAWQEPFKGDILLRMSVYRNPKWSAPKTIAKGDDWFVNWADFPAIVANGDELFVHYLENTDSKGLAYNIMYTVSSDLGDTWTKQKKLHEDTTATEHGFVSAVPYKDGFYVSWLDGRNTHGNTGNFGLRAAFVSVDGTVTNRAELDNNTCTCCQTTMTLVNNQPWVFYRNRTEDEIRDIYFTNLTDSGWVTPTSLNPDNWHIAGCPVNGPVATTYKNTMAIAWFTGANGDNKVKLKISDDAGRSFSDEIIVEDIHPIGRVDVAMDSTKIYVSYMADREDEASIILKVYNYSGTLLDTEIMIAVSPDRDTGFPRIAIWREFLIFTWTDIDLMKVKALSYPLDPNSIMAKSRLY